MLVKQIMMYKKGTMRKPYEDVSDDIKVMATDIITIVSQIFGVDKEVILSKRRHEHIITARAACFALLCKVERVGPVDAAAIFKKDHSSAIHAIKVHHNSYDTNHFGYCNKYEKCLALYYMSKDKKALEENDAVYGGISAIEKKINRLLEIKRKLIECRLQNKKIDSQLLNAISQEMPPEVTLNLYESNISKGINIKNTKHEPENQPIND